MFCENGLETLGFNSPSLNPKNCRLNGDKKLLTQKINMSGTAIDACAGAIFTFFHQIN